MEPRHYKYLDCARGYAILMVITSHTTFAYPGLPWPVKQITSTGWFGVQLFFIASCVTLLMSWRAQQRSGTQDMRAFAIRRYFRVAPAYYLAAALYLVVLPPETFSWTALLAAVTFTNGWSPHLLTAPTAWSVVPGGWSISVEMSFYVLFPLYAAWAVTLRRAVLALVAAVLLGLCANLAVLAFGGADGRAAGLGSFLFFWLPNQLSVFAIGGVLFHLVPVAQSSALCRRIAPVVAAAALVGFCALAYLPAAYFIGDGPRVPASHAAALVLAVFVLALSVRGGIFTNTPIAALGRVSFSAYLLHWAVLHAMRAVPAWFHLDATGVGAILAFAGGLLVMTVGTFALASISARLIERPMVRLGAMLIQALPKPRQGFQPAA